MRRKARVLHCEEKRETMMEIAIYTILKWDGGDVGFFLILILIYYANGHPLFFFLLICFRDLFSEISLILETHISNGFI